MIGKTLGNAIIEQEIDRGAMAVVYRGTHRGLEKPVAVKVLNLGAEFPDDHIKTQFCKEAEILAKLDHPNIATVYEFGETDGVFYIVSQLIDGPTLKQRIAREKKIRPDESLHILRAVLNGLEYSHNRGLIHRDVKPGNIVFDSQGNAHITDFGLVKSLDLSRQLTLPRQWVGTPYYMSPEQWDSKPDSPQMDIWATGATWYHMLSGEPPFNGHGPAEIIKKVVTENLRPLSEHRVRIPPSMEAILRKMLEKETQKRYPNVREVLRDLDNFAFHEQPVVSLEEADRQLAPEKFGLPSSTSRVGRRVRLGTVALVILMLAALGSSGYFYHKSKKELRLWVSAQIPDTYGSRLNAYRKYLSRYPSGKFAPKARAYVKRLEARLWYQFGYADFLPETTLAVAVIDRPAKLIEKIDPDNYPNLFANLRNASKRELEFDVTHADAYREKGIDLGKPCGIALVSVENKDAGRMPVFAVFLGVNDQQKFESYIRRMFISHLGAELNSRTVAGVSHTTVYAGERPLGVFCFKAGFWVCYFSHTSDLEGLMQLSGSGSRLSDSEVVQNTLAGLEQDSDFYVCVNVESAKENMRRNRPEMSALLEEVVPGDAGAFALSSKIEGPKLTISFYLQGTEKMLRYFANSGCSHDVFRNFPRNPLLCLSCNLPAEKIWHEYRPRLKHLADEILSWERTARAAGKIREIFASAAIPPDLVNDIVRNIQGNVAFALYSLPQVVPKGRISLDFNAATAIRLKSPEEGGELLDEIIAVIKDRGILVAERDIQGKTVYTADLSTFSGDRVKFGISPTAGIWNDYLILASKPDTFESIVQGYEGSLLDSIRSSAVASYIGSGRPLTVYADLRKIGSEIFKKLVPATMKKDLVQELTEPFYEFTWCVSPETKGIKSTIDIHAYRELLFFLYKADEYARDRARSEETPK